MYQSYKAQCSLDGRQAVSKPTFSRRLRELGYTVEKRGHHKQTMVNAESDADRERRRKAEERKVVEVPT